jgi:NADP-dependent 3-hydroxy acid dehydrogenase YdfG
LHFARAGASLTIVARKQETLDASRDAILRERPSAQVLTFPADVRDVKKAEEAVAATIARFGRLDVLVENAGTLRPAFQRARLLVSCVFKSSVHGTDLRRNYQLWPAKTPSNRGR